MASVRTAAQFAQPAAWIASGHGAETVAHSASGTLVLDGVNNYF